MKAFLNWFFGPDKKPDYIYFKGRRACFDLAAYLVSDEGYERIKRLAYKTSDNEDNT